MLAARWPSLALVGLLAVLPAAAQTGRLVRPIAFEAFNGFVEVGYDLQSQEREPPLDGRIFHQDETALLYGVGGDIDGSFLHPSLLPFSVGGTLRLRRSEIDANTGRFQGSRNADASQYRLRLGILPAFRWNGELAANQIVQDIDSTFAPTRRIQRRDARLTLRRRSRSWPLVFYAEKSRSKGIEGDPRDETRSSLGMHVDHGGETATTNFDTEVLDYVERSTRQDYRQVRLSFSQRFRVLPSRTLVLNTTVLGYDRQGTTDSRFTIAAQGVDWTPTEDFRVGSRFERTDQRDRFLGRLVIDRTTASLEHRLWGSLATTASLDLQRSRLPEEGRERVNEARLDLDYARHLEAGTLEIGLGRRLRRDDLDLPAGRQLVSEEHLVEDGLPILLDTPGILPETVEVTDVTGTVLYVEGIDYELIDAGGLFELRILAGSAIQPGDTLRVRFTIETSRALDVRTRVNRMRAGWRDRSGAWLRLIREKQVQELLAGIADGRIDQVTDAIYAGGVTRRRWRIAGERRVKRSEILPYKRTGLTLRWTVFDGRRTDLAFDAQKELTTFPDRPGERIDLERAGFDLRVRLRRLRLVLRADRWDEFVLDRNGRFFEGQVQIAWRFRAFELIARARRRLQDIEMSGRDDRDELTVVVRRYFR